MKKVIVIGVGAQGSTIAKRLQEDATVSEIICADYDLKATQELSNTLDKARAVQLDATNVDNVIKASQGVDLIVNGLPLEYNLIIMEAALAVEACYLDMAGPMIEEIGFIESYKLIFSEWSDRFREKGLTALVGCGSSPGLANVIARDAVDNLDTCAAIGIYVYDAVWANKFTPFWWSPEVAFKDMGYITFRYENGEIVTDEPFSRPVMMKFKGIDEDIRMVDHEHDEPITMGLLADKVLKGVKNVEFKYGGPAVELSEYLYKMGLLSLEPVDVKGAKIAPMDLVLKLAPSAPKYPDEIKAIIAEGMAIEEGVFLVRVEGQKAGQTIRIDRYVNCPGLAEAFEKAELSHESYNTGQCAAVFTKMMVEDVFSEKGLFSPEELNLDARMYCFRELSELGITIDEIIEQRLY